MPKSYNAVMADKTDLIIDARGIVKRFGGVTVLDGADVSAAAGEVVGILGSSGSGKSTLLRCLNVLEIPDGGTLSVCGEKIELSPPDEKQLRHLRRKVPMVFQHFNLWAHLTALENVAEAPRTVLGLSKKAARELAAEMLRKVGVAERAAHYPSQLSGGQQQRVGIARALAMSPSAILFDEPTSALDPELVGEVLRVMRALAEEKTTMLVVTHEIAFARELADKIIFLERGKITAAGPPSILDSPEHERLRKFAAGGK